MARQKRCVSVCVCVRVFWSKCSRRNVHDPFSPSLPSGWTRFWRRDWRASAKAKGGEDRSRREREPVSSRSSGQRVLLTEVLHCCFWKRSRHLSLNTRANRVDSHCRTGCAVRSGVECLGAAPLGGCPLRSGGRGLCNRTDHTSVSLSRGARTTTVECPLYYPRTVLCHVRLQYST